MDIINILIQALVYGFMFVVFLDIFHATGLEEFVIEEFERIWLGDCTPIRYFDCILEEPEQDIALASHQ